jgi:hypothetical protein
MSEGPRLNVDLMFEDVFKERPEHLRKQRALMLAEHSERTASGLQAEGGTRAQSTRPAPVEGT